MAETSSNVTIQDVPEYMKPYRQALLNAAFGLTFTPEYLKGQGLNTMAGYAPQAPPPEYTPPGQPPTTDLPVDPYAYSQPLPGGSQLSRGAAGIEEALRSNRIQYAHGGVIRAATGSQLSESAKAIEDLLVQGANPGSDVYLSPGGTPLGGVYNGNNVAPTPQPHGPVPTGTQTPPPPQLPPVTPPAYAGPNGVINTPPSGTLSFGQNPAPGQPGGQNRQSDTTAMFLGQKPGNFAGSSQAAALGYNPAQYADEDVAKGLADKMGGKVVYTNTGGPIGPPSQATISFGGEAFNNAGLINDAYTRFKDDPGQLQLRLSQIRDEIRSLGGTPGFKKGGSVRMAGGGSTDPTAMSAEEEYNAGAPASPPNPFAPPPTQTSAPASNPFTMPSYYGGSSYYGAPNFSAMNPYIGYSGPRTLDSGYNFGQVGPNGTPQISDLSRQAFSGYSYLPSAFDRYGNINAGRNENGEATTNYGIANDTFNSAGQLALDASRRAGDMSYYSPLYSSFGNTMDMIRNDPSKFMAGEISLGDLYDNQMDLPAGISASQLKSYQMAGPRMIDMNGAYANARDVAGGRIDVGSFLDPGVADQYMSPYQKAVNDVRRKDAEQAFKEQNAGRQAAAVRAGAFGGTRQAVADSLAEREMLRQKDRITAEGQQEAFANAQSQYERDRAAKMSGDTFNVNSRFQGDIANQQKDISLGTANLQSWLQAQLANQAALQDANKTNLGASLDVQKLGAEQAFEASKSNQNAGLQAAIENLRARQATQQLGRTTGLEAAKLNQSTRLTQNQALLDAAAREDQLRQQADQGNYTNRLSALDRQMQGALGANTIGQSRADLQRLAQATELQRLQQMQSAGAGIDSRTQSNMDMQYQDFINQRNYPYQQLNWLQGLYSGVPQGFNQEQVLFNRTNPASQIGGLATAGVGALSSYLGKKKGGIVKERGVAGLKKVIDMKKQRDGSYKAA